MSEHIKKALRISGTAFDDELNSLISACAFDLKTAGIVAESVDESLLEIVTVLYVKSYFGDNVSKNEFLKLYDNYKCTLSMVSRYNGNDNNTD